MPNLTCRALPYLAVPHCAQPSPSPPHLAVPRLTCQTGPHPASSQPTSNNRTPPCHTCRAWPRPDRPHQNEPRRTKQDHTCRAATDLARTYPNLSYQTTPAVPYPVPKKRNATGLTRTNLPCLALPGLTPSRRVLPHDPCLTTPAKSIFTNE